MNSNRIGVIGSGLAGLAAACTLAARNYDVVVFERNEWLGGKAAVLHRDGFRFDMGPTILIQPSNLRRIFEEAGVDIDSELQLVKLDPQWKSFFNDGSTLNLYSEIGSMRNELKAFSPGADNQYNAFLNCSEDLHRISNEWFFWKSIDSIWDTFDPMSAFQLSLLKDVRRMRMGQSVSGTIKSFVKDTRVVQMLEHFTQYIGSAPDASPAVLCAIAHMQTSEGVWYPIGGIGEIPKALVRLAKKLGVEFRVRSGIRRILHDQERAYGVELESGEQVQLAAVVSDADAIRTHTELLQDTPKKGFRYADAEPACSGVVMYLGLKERYEHLEHHNFVFSRNAEQEFDDIYRKGKPAEDPTCYVCAPARTDPAVAPAGGEALYILVHTPYLRSHHNWKTLYPEYRKTIIDKLRRCGGMQDIEDRIVTESYLTPEDIHNRYSVLNGAIYGIASHGRFTGAFKPGNKSKLLEGLFLCGGAAHPGPGMPMVLMSGWIAANALDESGCAAKGSRGWSRAV